jgi:hypothetical protein
VQDTPESELDDAPLAEGRFSSFQELPFQRSTKRKELSSEV